MTSYTIQLEVEAASIMELVTKICPLGGGVSLEVKNGPDCDLIILRPLGESESTSNSDGGQKNHILVQDLDLTSRTKNALIRANIRSVGDIRQVDFGLECIHMIGGSSIQELIEAFIVNDIPLKGVCFFRK